MVKRNRMRRSGKGKKKKSRLIRAKYGTFKPLPPKLLERMKKQDIEVTFFEGEIIDYTSGFKDDVVYPYKDYVKRWKRYRNRETKFLDKSEAKLSKLKKELKKGKEEYKKLIKVADKVRTEFYNKYSKDKVKEKLLEKYPEFEKLPKTEIEQKVWAIWRELENKKLWSNPIIQKSDNLETRTYDIEEKIENLEDEVKSTKETAEHYDTIIEVHTKHKDWVRYVRKAWEDYAETQDRIDRERQIRLEKAREKGAERYEKQKEKKEELKKKMQFVKSEDLF